MPIAIDDRIGLLAIAKLFGVALVAMNQARPYLEQFPAAEKIGKKKYYSLAAVNDWAKGKDVKALIREGKRKYQCGELAAASDCAQLLNLSRRWHAGEFDAEEQRYFHAIKRWTARDRQPQTTTVHVRPSL